MTLTDEMGLGKTVELLACVFAHQKPASDDGMLIDTSFEVVGDQEIKLQRLKRERVECICGAVSESHRGKKKRSAVELQKHTRKKDMTKIVVPNLNLVFYSSKRNNEDVYPAMGLTQIFNRKIQSPRPVLVSEEKMVVLTKKNFSNFITQNQQVMVVFYSSQYFWRNRLSPKSSAAAMKRKGNLVVAKVDAEKEKLLAKKYKIGNYPTLTLQIRIEHKILAIILGVTHTIECGLEQLENGPGGGLGSARDTPSTPRRSADQGRRGSRARRRLPVTRVQAG
ncbi:hypothetical protein Pint_27347 [Pistacia integerrima]|uniref:Uncharacterized protein n=1 Tax=Pistacia integerrima TaxID=434235 RepID=A0ACC0YPW7_9ROSI|nr:hypothetical protein Pint_27347 [Pistacia integerrima]